MDDEIQLISDGDGLAVIGEQGAVERFLASEGLESKDLGLPRLSKVLQAGSSFASVGSEVAASSGRWVKLTKESARLIDKHGLTETAKHVHSGVVRNDKGQIKGVLTFAKGAGAKSLTNPALLAGAAGLMAQLAMQQAMNEITDYLAVIDAKVDDVLRAQKDSVIADMIGVQLVIEEAMTIRETVGRVSDITWSKVQGTTWTVARTQAYALAELDALAKSVESQRKISDLVDKSQEADSRSREWLAVLARCFQLQDAIAVLELDRMLDAAPEELEQHRVGLRIARANRLDAIGQTTENLVSRLEAAASTANDKVLLHPTGSRDVVRASNHVATAVTDLQSRLGLEGGRQSLEARRWTQAAADAKDRAIERGAGGADVARRLGTDSLRVGTESLGRAKSVSGKLSGRIGERSLRRRGKDEAEPDED
ncbi:hypothetical protein ASD62_11110 [Phycicoccus sp. Root563]|uniref:hypothetical protein n=1 Tax=Phycicoccus sp. Root563 TaxID=1736562 RepID=UPI000702740E|nr:hypothetical protein [Phycicoccus sp. Root563]KQZ89768.1 hypothetical protein ASD62_11110 [Phycicoccus sp. Root563]